MTLVQTDSATNRLTQAGYVIDGRIAGWKVQLRRHALVATVSGEIDASNAARFAENAFRQVTIGDPFIIDLSKLEFLGLQGFSALLDLEKHCREVGVPWAVVTGPALRPLLRVMDSDHLLPVVGSVGEALEQFGYARQRLRAVVSIKRAR